MTTGVLCTISPHCREPAPPETRVCHCHERLARAAALRQSPSAATRIATRALLLVTQHHADREAGG